MGQSLIGFFPTFLLIGLPSALFESILMIFLILKITIKLFLSPLIGRHPNHIQIWSPFNPFHKSLYLPSLTNWCQYFFQHTYYVSMRDGKVNMFPTLTLLHTYTDACNAIRVHTSTHSHTHTYAHAYMHSPKCTHIRWRIVMVTMHRACSVKQNSLCGYSTTHTLTHAQHMWLYVFKPNRSSNHCMRRAFFCLSVSSLCIWIIHIKLISIEIPIYQERCVMQNCSLICNQMLLVCS